MGLYQRRIDLYDLEDVEAVCTSAARRFSKGNCPQLPQQDFESLVAFVVSSVWGMSERYDPELSTSFAAIARNQLHNRCIDWFRLYVGRTRWQFEGHLYERTIERPVSLDTATSADGEALEASVGAVDGDLEAGFGADPFGGLLNDRDGEAPW